MAYVINDLRNLRYVTQNRFMPEIKHKYLVVHYKGLGVQESPRQDMGVVYSANDINECCLKADELLLAHKANDESNWNENAYSVVLNTGYN